MQTSTPSVSRVLVMVVFALSCFGLLLFLWLSFGGPIPLKPKGYRVEVAGDGEQALRSVAGRMPDIVVLDLMLPRLGGLEVCRRLRRDGLGVPIVMLTALGEEEDRVLGLELGADDYVTKPFSVKVLLQRIKALQRRAEGAGEATDVIEYLDVRIDRVRHRAYVEGRELDLTPTEFRLLECMLRQPGRAFSRQQLMDAAIGEGAIVLERTIDVHIKTLRRKLGTGDLIETVRGVGYRFRETRR